MQSDAHLNQVDIARFEERLRLEKSRLDKTRIKWQGEVGNRVPASGRQYGLNAHTLLAQFH